MQQSLVVGVDGSPESILALRRSSELASAESLSLIVTHVRQISPWLGIAPNGPAIPGVAELEAEVRRISAEVLRSAGVQWDFVVRTGDPAYELMDLARVRSAVGIVVGGRPHPAIARAMFGSVAARLVRHAHCSVLVIREEPGSERFESPGVRERHLLDQAIDAIYGEALPKRCAQAGA